MKVFYILVRFVYRVLKALGELVCLPFHKDYYIGDCYFPEYINHRKGVLMRLIDQIIYTLKFGEPNKFYFLYGLDIKGLHDKNDFVDYGLFMKRRSCMDGRVRFNAIPVLRDKSLFGIVASVYGINTPHNVGVIQNGRVYSFADKKECELDEYIKSITLHDFFIKKIDGECADGVFHAIIINGILMIGGNAIDYLSFFDKNNRYLIQENICKQHPAISAIFGGSINTLRLVTVENPQTSEIEVFSCVLRVGTGNNCVDNWAAGGLSIGVDINRCVLREFGFYKPGFGTKATKHPDTGVTFKDYEIPFLQEAIDMALLFHHRLYGIHSIGWDIAITEDGPCFVEGNDNWEISLMQISNHGLQKEFDQLFY